MARSKTATTAPQVEQQYAPNELVESLKEENALLAAEVVRLKAVLRFTTGKHDYD